jgi:hypothetical protein
MRFVHIQMLNSLCKFNGVLMMAKAKVDETIETKLKKQAIPKNSSQKHTLFTNF